MSFSVLKLCLLGPTGSGKSSIAKYIAAETGAEIIKVAKPLYEMQAAFYQQIGRSVSGQDGELLQFLGAKVEKENPGWLTRQFISAVGIFKQCLLGEPE